MNLNREAQFPFLIDKRGYRVGIEVGVDHGMFSEVLLRRSGLEVLYSVDSWANEVGLARVNEVAERLRRFGPRSRIRQCTSAEFAASMIPGQADFVYLDADHSYESVVEDIAMYWPIVRSGGCLAGHDYGERRHKRGVLNAVNEFVAREGLALHLTTEDCVSWYVFKP